MEYCEGFRIFGNRIKYRNINSTKILLANGEKLISIDCTNNIHVTNLQLFRNHLENIDLSLCEDLLYLDICQNKLLNLDLSNNLKLEYLLCNKNNLTSLDISKNTKLIQLDIDNIVDINKVKHINKVNIFI